MELNGVGGTVNVAGAVAACQRGDRETLRLVAWSDDSRMDMLREKGCRGSESARQYRVVHVSS